MPPLSFLILFESSIGESGYYKCVCLSFKISSFFPIDLSYWGLISKSLTSALMFVISFFLQTLSLVLLFLVPWGVKLDCLFESFLVSFWNHHLRICLLTWERGRREKHWRGREPLFVTSGVHPNWGLTWQPRYVPWPAVEPTAFWCIRWCSNDLSHMARASFFT